MKVDNSIALMQTKRIPNIDETKLNKLDEKKLREKTDEFEALIIKEILDITLKPNSSSLFPKDPGEKIYQSMYNDTMSKALSGNFGFSELLFNYLTKKY